MRSNTDITAALERYGDTIWRVCVLYFRPSADAEDAFQETLLKYALSRTIFRSEEHRKAWLIRVATNVCKDMLKAAHRQNQPLDDQLLSDLPDSDGMVQTDGWELREILELIHNLSDPPRTALYLALYEGYPAPEIARMLDAPVNTVYSWISRGKQQLKELLQ
ncbi:MAG: RNA polymerase sigma factor [Actinomycetia bacterium]|nr:RNA polymerase sigma factor [Actinomycetes bacterium]